MRVFNRHKSDVRLVVKLRINDLFDVSHVEHTLRIIDGHELHARITRRSAHLEAHEVLVLASDHKVTWLGEDTHRNLVGHDARDHEDGCFLAN